MNLADLAPLLVAEEYFGPGRGRQSGECLNEKSESRLKVDAISSKDEIGLRGYGCRQRSAPCDGS